MNILNVKFQFLRSLKTFAHYSQSNCEMCAKNFVTSKELKAHTEDVHVESELRD